MTSYKCNDCGTPDFRCTKATRADVCDDCWGLRGQILPALNSGRVTHAELSALQRTMANSRGSGRGARAMREALGLDQPQI
jgi:hypothetical protein